MNRCLTVVVFGCLLLQSILGADTNYKEAQAGFAEAIDFKKGQERIADSIQGTPVANARMFLYSLDPHDSRRFEGKLPENSDESFHGYPILGRVEIIPVQEKTNLLAALASGVRESNGMVAECFDPRHGLRIISASATNDFAICFTCLQVEEYGFIDGRSFHGRNFLISGTQRPTFDKALDQYKLKKAAAE